MFPLQKILHEQEMKNIEFGDDGMNARGRRNSAITDLPEFTCIIAGRKQADGSVISDPDYPTVLRLALSKDDECISALFSPNAITCVVETQDRNDIIHHQSYEDFLKYMRAEYLQAIDQDNDHPDPQHN